METSYFRSDDGMPLCVRHWPASVPERGVVHIVHGLAEHAMRYERTALALNREGWTAYAHDHRGHGQTAGSLDRTGFLASTDGWNLVVEDLRLLLEEERHRHARVPLALLGHSMGSFIAQVFMGRHGRLIDGCVLSGGGGMPDATVYFLKTLAYLERLRIGKRGRSRLLHRLSLNKANRAFRPTRTRFDWLSRDAAEVAKFDADSFCGWVGSAQLWIDLITLATQAWSPQMQAGIPKDLPLYIIAGTMDPVSNGCRQLERLLEIYRRLGVRNLQHRFYTGGRHEMLNEINRDEVLADLIAWLNSLRKPRPAGDSPAAKEATP